jgi:hypothetical protein
MMSPVLAMCREGVRERLWKRMTSHSDNFQWINSLQIPLGSLQFHTDIYFPSRRECRVTAFTCGDFAGVLSFTARQAAGDAYHPGIPCALCCSREKCLWKLGRDSRRESVMHVPSSLTLESGGRRRDYLAGLVIPALVAGHQA